MYRTVCPIAIHKLASKVIDFYLCSTSPLSRAILCYHSIPLAMESSPIAFFPFFSSKKTLHLENIYLDLYERNLARSNEDLIIPWSKKDFLERFSIYLWCKKIRKRRRIYHPCRRKTSMEQKKFKEGKGWNDFSYIYRWGKNRKKDREGRFTILVEERHLGERFSIYL